MAGGYNSGRAGGGGVAVELTVAEGVGEPSAQERAVVGRAVEAVLEAHGVAGASVCVHLADDALLRTLNRTYRALDRPTDVLSFGVDPDDPAPLPPGEPAHLGDVVVSLERAAAQAEAYGHSRLRELCYLAVHGALHLLGLDDADEAGASAMAASAEAVLAGMGIGR